MDLAIDPSRWENTGSEEDPGSRLMLRDGMTINGFPFHVEAFAVVDKDDGQHAADEAFESSVDTLIMFSDTALQTQPIGGREYLIAITPHGN